MYIYIYVCVCVWVKESLRGEREMRDERGERERERKQSFKKEKQCIKDKEWKTRIKMSYGYDINCFSVLVVKR